MKGVKKKYLVCLTITNCLTTATLAQPMREFEAGLSVCPANRQRKYEGNLFEKCHCFCNSFSICETGENAFSQDLSTCVMVKHCTLYII